MLVLSYGVTLALPIAKPTITGSIWAARRLGGQPPDHWRQAGPGVVV